MSKDLIVNILVHPGYCIEQEGYNPFVYDEQLNKGDINIFLHPQLPEYLMKFHLFNEYGYIIEEVLKNRNFEELKELDTYEYRNGKGKHLNHYLLGFTFNQQLKKEYKGYLSDKDIVDTLMINRDKYINMLVSSLPLNTFTPFFRNHMGSYEYVAFKRRLLMQYGMSIHGHNYHIDATDLISSFNLIGGVVGTIQNKKVIVFGEHYNQCVKTVEFMLRSLNINFETDKSLCSFNARCKLTSHLFREEDNHFLVERENIEKDS